MSALSRLKHVFVINQTTTRHTACHHVFCACQVEKLLEERQHILETARQRAEEKYVVFCIVLVVSFSSCGSVGTRMEFFEIGMSVVNHAS